MNTQIFSRSKSLNLIPERKLTEKQRAVAANCAQCSALNINWNEESSADGLCAKCVVKYTAYNRWYSSNIPVEYWDLRMEKDFIGFEGLLTQYQEFTKDVRNVYLTGKSICLVGQCGTGKTMTINCVLKKAALASFQCLYTTLSDVVATLTSADTEDKFLARRELLTVDFLAIDEVDNRFFNQSASSNELFVRSFEAIIRTRLQNNLPTLLATNSPNLQESFAPSFRESLGSLMSKIPNFIVIGQDHRKIV